MDSTAQGEDQPSTISHLCLGYFVPAKRRIDPDFEIEPWLGALIDYCVSGGPRPAMRASAETPEPTRSY